MKNAIHVICVVLAAIVFQIFFVLCMYELQGRIAQWIFLTSLIGGSIINAALMVVEIVFYLLNKEIVYKTCITAYTLLLFLGICAYILLRTGFFDIIRDEKAFENYLRESGSWMSVLFITLQFLQVVILPIPSFVTVAAGTALFGPLLNIVYSLTGIVLGSVTAFLIGRYAGYRAVAWMVGKDTLDKWLKKVEGKDKLLLSAMFLLPVFPDDVLCFVAGLSSMSFVMFIVVILVSRILAIATTSYSITLIPLNKPWGIAVWVTFFALVIVLFVFLYKKSDAIQAWFVKKFHRESRRKERVKKDQFTLQVIDPEGTIVTKGVDKGDEAPHEKSANIKKEDSSESGAPPNQDDRGER